MKQTIEISREEVKKVITEYLVEEFKVDISGKKLDTREQFGGWQMIVTDRQEEDEEEKF